jgi:ubiquitin-conjugating enzyme E2 S
MPCVAERTPYEGGEFHVKLSLGSDFPAAPPKGTFLTRIFHPNISAEGDICVNTLKRDWKPEVGLSHVLQVIRCLLIVPFPESSLNDDAGKLFMESYDEYARRAKLMTTIHAKKAEPASASVAATSSEEEAPVAAEATADEDLPASAAASSTVSRKTSHDDGRGASFVANENKKMKPDPSVLKKASGSDKPAKARKALKRL